RRVAGRAVRHLSEARLVARAEGVRGVGVSHRVARGVPPAEEAAQAERERDRGGHRRGRGAEQRTTRRSAATSRSAFAREPRRAHASLHAITDAAAIRRHPRHLARHREVAARVRIALPAPRAGDRVKQKTMVWIYVVIEALVLIP